MYGRNGSATEYHKMADSTPTPYSDAVLDGDAEWIARVAKMARARVLMDHLAAFDATICVGGVKGIEPPMEQTATWRRVFCYELSKSNTPLNIVPNEGGKLPKCIAICQLSGKHCIFYSESMTLAKVLCLSVQEVRRSIADGVADVVKRAQELDATVFVTFCLPFQSGLERAHWDVRTLRKTTKGAVKDGELAFSSGDSCPRTVPCTRAMEHWTDTLVAEVSKKLVSTATAVCLDSMSGDEGRKMDASAMESMIEVLKSDRRKLMDAHRAEILRMQAQHKEEVEKADARVRDAEDDASVRISKVASASKAAEEVMKKKEQQIHAHNISLREQVVALTQSKEQLYRDFNATTLRSEEDGKKAAARQKTLEAQVASLRKDAAKTAEEWAKQQRSTKDAAKERKRLEAKVAELEALGKSRDAACNAVQASAKEARDQVREARAQVKETQDGLADAQKDSQRAKASVRVLKATLKLVSSRYVRAVHDAAEEARLAGGEALQKAEAAAEELRGRVVELDAAAAAAASAHEAREQTLRAELGRAEQAEKPDCEKRIKEAQQEIGRKKHLLGETDKRVKYLERALKASDEEVRRLKTEGTDENTKATVSPARQGHQQAYPHAHYSDHQLEHTISTLHSALNSVTALARSAAANGKSAELAHAKLDALSSFGINYQQQPQYYEYQGQPYPRG